MGLFKQNKPPTEGRPDGSDGDTGLNFGGWYTIASNTLVQASRDDDPRCMKVFIKEAREAAEIAELYAKNVRQERMAKTLLDSISEVEVLAKRTPPLETPHSHEDGCELS